MYIPALPKESASVRKDESIDSASTPYARYKSNNSATGEGMNSVPVKYFRHREVKRVFENLAQRFLLSGNEKAITFFVRPFDVIDVTGQDDEQLSTLSALHFSTVKSVYIIPAWENSQSKSGDTSSKTDNLENTTTDKHPIQTVYRFSIGLSKANRADDRQQMQTVQNRLMELLQEEEECDTSKPTAHSFTTAWKLVKEASELRGKYFQKATVSTDDEGGIRLRWRNSNKDREVRLYCPANTTKKMYIYHEEGDSYKAEYNVSGRTLADWLYWLSDA